MNDSQIRAAFPIPEPSLDLDAKVDRALAHHRRVRRVRRGVLVGTLATASAVLAFVALPAVQASASLSGIVDAMDAQTRARIVTYSLDEQGRRWPTATTTIANGDAAYVDVRGDRQSYDLGDRSYTLDPTVGRFIVRPRRRAASLRLSSMLGPAGEFSLGKRSTVERTGAILRATVVNEGLGERYVIEADPKTELPFALRVESLERGAWRTRQTMAFDYDAKAVLPQPDLVRYPVATEAAASAAFDAAMTRHTLAELPLEKGRLVVRAVDVARDGTVFVAFQTGDRSPHSWRGYSLDLEDAGGIRYVRRSQVMGDEEGPFGKDGKLEAEIFVPTRPVAPDVPRTLTLVTHRKGDGKLLRSVDAQITSPDGTVWKGLQFDGVDHNGPPPPPVPVLAQRGVRPTCDTHPAWMSRLDYTGFGNPVAAQLTKADVRAHVAMDAKDWPEAERWLEEGLRLRREHDRQGYGPWDLARPLADLDRVHAAMRP